MVAPGLPSVITLTGPAGAGTGTIGRLLAEKYGYTTVDSGALYRVMGIGLLDAGISLDDPDRMIERAREFEVKLTPGDPAHYFLNGKDVTERIRTPEGALGASKCGAVPEIRDLLLELQRDFCRQGGAVLDGQDAGSVVYPEAELKIYLTAEPEVRARRRWQDFQRQGIPDTYEDVLEKIKERDARDMNRPVAPLAPAEDAVIIRTDEETPKQTFRRIQSLVTRTEA